MNAKNYTFYKIIVLFFCFFVFTIGCSSSDEKKDVKEEVKEDSDPKEDEVVEEEEESENPIVYTHDVNIPEELRERAGLPNFFNKITTGADIKVGFIGGSITNQKGWRENTFTSLETKYPTVNFSQVNAAVAGTGADFAACRAKQYLLAEKPDLVFIEYRVNGGGGFEARAIEGLVRQIWEDSPNTDICFVYTIATWILKDLELGKQYWFGKVMENIANVYGIPSIDFGVEVVKQLKAGDLIFQGPNPIAGKLVFSKDGVHPKEDGHKLYSDIVARSLETMRSIDKPLTHVLPMPLESKHFGNATLLSISDANFNSGWETVNINSDALYRSDRERSNKMLNGAIKSNVVGSTVTIDWEGVLIGFNTIPIGTDMTVEVSTDGGVVKTFTFKQGSDRIFFADRFYAPELSDGQHTTTLKITKLTEGASFYLGQLLIIGLPK